jgi:hypothetical protein
MTGSAVTATTGGGTFSITCEKPWKTRTQIMCVVASNQGQSCGWRKSRLLWHASISAPGFGRDLYTGANLRGTTEPRRRTSTMEWRVIAVKSARGQWNKLERNIRDEVVIDFPCRGNYGSKRFEFIPNY